MDRRSCSRLDLKLNVEFLREGEERQATRVGTTDNVSPGGMYFHTGEWGGLRTGDEVDVRLSGLSGYGAGPLFRTLRARAQVLRLNPPEGAPETMEKAGVAVRFVEKLSFDEMHRWSE
jgi:hypothetical protein